MLFWCNQAYEQFVPSWVIKLSILKLIHVTSTQVNCFSECPCNIISVGLVVLTVYCDPTTMLAEECSHNYQIVYYVAPMTESQYGIDCCDVSVSCTIWIISHRAWALQLKSYVLVYSLLSSTGIIEAWLCLVLAKDLCTGWPCHNIHLQYQWVPKSTALPGGSY